LFHVHSENAFKYTAVSYSYIPGGPFYKLKVFHGNHTFTFTETFDFAFKILNYCVRSHNYIYRFIKFGGQKKRKILADNLNINTVCIYTYHLTISNRDNID